MYIKLLKNYDTPAGLLIVIKLIYFKGGGGGEGEGWGWYRIFGSLGQQLGLLQN